MKPLASALDKALASAQSSYLSCVKAVQGRGGSSLASGPSGLASKPSTLTRAAEQYKSNVGWVYCCVKAIAQKLAERSIFVGALGKTPKRSKSIGDDIERMDSHAILDLLSDPNPLMTKWPLVYVTVANLELTGRANWWLTEEKGKPQLWPLPSNWCEPDDPFRGSWTVRPKDSSESFRVDGDDMVYFSLPDPSDPFGCLSPLQSQAPAVATDEAIQTAQYRTFQNGLFPGVMIRAGRLPNMLGTGEGQRPVLTEAQKRELYEAVRSVYQGAANFNRPFIVDGLIESIERFSLTPAELDFLNSGKVTKSRIFEAFGVSPFAVGQVENGNRAQAMVAQQTLAENVLNPLATLLSESMTAWLGPRFAAKGERLVVWIDKIVPRDTELDSSNWANALRSGACTYNEYRRAVLNLPDMPNGDKPLNMIDQLFRTSATTPPEEMKQPPLGQTWEYDRLVQEVANGNGCHNSQE